MCLLDGDDAAIRPGIARNGIERCGKIGNADGKLLLARGHRPDHRALTVLGGIRVRHQYVKRDHVLLHGDCRVLPVGKILDGEVAVLRRRRNLAVELNTDLFHLLMVEGAAHAKTRGRGTAAAAIQERQGEGDGEKGDEELQHNI